MREIPDRISPWREDLTERELHLLEALDEQGRTMPEIVKELDVPDNFQVREALIGLYTKLEGKGLVRRLPARGNRPHTWILTFKAKRVV